MIRFWDTSSLVPLLVSEPGTTRAEEIVRDQTGFALWWGTSVEIQHALGRRLREGTMDQDGLDLARVRLTLLQEQARIVEPSAPLRALAETIAFNTALRAADALQLAAALTSWGDLALDSFVTFDDRLTEAARAHGLMVLTRDP